MHVFSSIDVNFEQYLCNRYCAGNGTRCPVNCGAAGSIHAGWLVIVPAIPLQ